MLKRWLSILISVVFLFSVTPALAQDTTSVYNTYRLPEGKFVVSEEDQGTYMGYTIGQFKDLLRIDNDLRLADGILEQNKVIMQSQDKQLEFMDRALDYSDKNVELLIKDRDRITKLRTKDNKRMHKAEQKPFINVNGWLVGIAVVETVFIIVLIGMAGG